MEVGENGQIQEAVGVGGHRSCLPCLFFLLFSGVAMAREELTDSKPHQTTKYHANDKMQVIFIYLAFCDQKMVNPVFYGAFLAIS